MRKAKKKQPASKPAKSPAEPPATEHLKAEMLDRIVNLSSRLPELDKDLATAREKASVAKERAETARDKVDALAQSKEDVGRRIIELVNGVRAGQYQAVMGFMDTGDGKAPLLDQAEKAKADDESWRKELLTDHGADGSVRVGTARVVKALHAAGIGTLGQLADYSTKDRRLTDIKGIGEVAAAKIEDAVLQYHARRAGQPGAAKFDAIAGAE